MAKKHMRITIETDTYAVAQTIGNWLDGQLDKVNLDKNTKWTGDGDIIVSDSVTESEKTSNPRISIFMNVNEGFDRTGLMDKIKIKVVEAGVVSHLKYVKIETWICTHDEKHPQPCVPKIIYERTF